MELSQDDLKSILDYDPLTGVFTWKPRDRGFPTVSSMSRWNGRYAGKEAGTIQTKRHSGKQYRVINISGRPRPAHRLAFLIMEGSLPSNHVDHIDGDGLNNRWSNLRAATLTENNRNVRRSRKNKSGIIGVYFHGRVQKWAASIGVDGKQKHLGYFYSKYKAASVRKNAELRYGYHENHGRLG